MFKKWLRAISGRQPCLSMASAIARQWAGIQRQWRLVVRHARYGRASFTAVPSAAKSATLATLFRTVNAHLRRLPCDYWLVYGTLLGWHREGNLLAHDHDVDFGVPVAEFAKVWASRAALPPGFTMYDTSHRHHGPKLYVAHHGWEADIYFFIEHEGRLHSSERSANPGDMLPFPREWFYPPRATGLLGEPTWVPAQPEPYLGHVYRYLGPDAVRDPVTRYFRPR